MYISYVDIYPSSRSGVLSVFANTVVLKTLSRIMPYPEQILPFLAVGLAVGLCSWATASHIQALSVAVSLITLSSNLFLSILQSIIAQSQRGKSQAQGQAQGQGMQSSPSQVAPLGDAVTSIDNSRVSLVHRLAKSCADISSLKTHYSERSTPEPTPTATPTLASASPHTVGGIVLSADLQDTLLSNAPSTRDICLSSDSYGNETDVDTSSTSSSHHGESLSSILAETSSSSGDPARVAKSPSSLSASIYRNDMREFIDREETSRRIQSMAESTDQQADSGSQPPDAIIDSSRGLSLKEVNAGTCQSHRDTSISCGVGIDSHSSADTSGVAGANSAAATRVKGLRRVMSEFMMPGLSAGRNLGMGTVFGLSSTADRAARIVSPLLGGYFLETYGTMGLIYMSGSTLLYCLALIYATMPNRGTQSLQNGSYSSSILLQKKSN